MERTQVILENDFEALFRPRDGGRGRMCLSLSELLQDVEKGGVPLCEQAHMACVIGGMDQSCIH